MFPLLLVLAIAHGAEPTLVKPSDDWDVMPLDRKIPSLKARIESDFDGGRAVISLYVARSKKTIAAYTEEWAVALEKHMGLKRVVRKGELGGGECLVYEFKNELGHVTTWVAKRGDTVTMLHVMREGDAVDDEDVEAEIAHVHNAIRLQAPAAKPQPKPTEPAPEAKPKTSPREELKFAFWRLVLVKPKGLEQVTALDSTELENNVIARFEGRRGQAFLMIRVYARTKQKARRLTKLHEDRRKHVLKTYAGKFQERKDAPKWKPPLVKKIRRFEGTGKRKVSELRHWHVMDCRNDRQYEVDILATGAWTNEIADFLKNFRPVKKVK